MSEKSKEDIIYESVVEIRQDVKDLMAFKNKAVGIILACSIFSSGIFSIVIALIN